MKQVRRVAWWFSAHPWAIRPANGGPLGVILGVHLPALVGTRMQRGNAGLFLFSYPLSNFPPKQT